VAREHADDHDERLKLAADDLPLTGVALVERVDRALQAREQRWLADDLRRQVPQLGFGSLDGDRERPSPRGR
jgi:hypothetical protein